MCKLLYDFFCQQSEIKKLKKLGIKVEKKFIYSYYRLDENKYMNSNENNDELCSFQSEREENDTDKP